MLFRSNFKTSVAENAVVAVGQTLALDFQLEVGGASETVTVIGGGDAQIDRTDITVSGSGATRVAEARWPGADATAEMPSQITDVVDA